MEIINLPEYSATFEDWIVAHSSTQFCKSEIKHGVLELVSEEILENYD